MKFSYEFVPSMDDGTITPQPRIPITFTNPENGNNITIKALVDSGASMSFLNLAFAEDLGLDLSATHEGSVSSANKKGTAYYYDLKVQVQGDKRALTIPCGFMELRTDAVVGRNGFFDEYRILFEQYKYQFQLTRVEKL